MLVVRQSRNCRKICEKSQNKYLYVIGKKDAKRSNNWKGLGIIL